MQKLLFTMLCVCASLFSFSQLKTVAEGNSFEEPEKGFARILQMSNGSTLFIHFENRGNINVRVYDASHKEKAVTVVTPSYGKLSMGVVEEVFEVAGDAVVLLSEYDRRKRTLYRIIIDGKTGKLKDDKQIGELDKVTYGMSLTFGTVPQASFYTRRDLYGDTYAVVFFRSLESDRAKRIELVVYDGTHKEVSRAFISSPNDRYKYMQYVDMTITAPGKVSLIAYGYNTAASGGKESEVLLANLDKGASKADFSLLNLPQDVNAELGICRFNPVTNRIVMLIAAKNKKKWGKAQTYSCYLNIVNPETKKNESTTNIDMSDDIEAKLDEKYGKRGKFTGMPQNLYINDDGSFSVLSEEFEIFTMRDQYSNTVRTTLGDLLVSTYTAQGKAINSYYIPKRQWLEDIILDPFYHSEWEGGGIQLQRGHQFKSFAYIPGKSKNYVLFNDLEENVERQTKGKPANHVRSVSDCDAFVFMLEGNGLTPDRNYLFGEPEKRKEHNICLFAVSDFNRKTNTYATLRLTNTGKNKSVNLVWMQP